MSLEIEGSRGGTPRVFDGREEAPARPDTPIEDSGRATPLSPHETDISFLTLNNGLPNRDGAAARIPIVAITGTNGKTTTTRLIAHLVAGTGRHVGMTCTDGIYIDGRRIERGDCSGPDSARQVLSHPGVEVAVLETARGGILRAGLAFAHCDVAVVTNIGAGDHLEQRGIETLDELARLKRKVVEAAAPSGYAVLNADDPIVAAMAAHSAAQVAWFTFDPDQPVIVDHRACGGRAVFLRAGTLILAEGASETAILPVHDIPMTHTGRARFQVENALAAAAAAWGLGLSVEAIRTGLESFEENASQTPARFNVLSARGATVIIDYAHNAPALSALSDATRAFPRRHSSIVYAPSDRRDADVIEQGEVLAGAFDRVILYANEERGDRDYARLNALFRRGLATGPKAREVIEIEGELPAIDRALQDLRPGDLLVIAAEVVDDALAHAQTALGVG